MNAMQVSAIVSVANCPIRESRGSLTRAASRPLSLRRRLQALALQAAAGDPAAWQALWKAVLDSSLILSWARKRFNSRDDAEDAASEALIRAIKGFPTYEPRLSKFTTWVYKVAHNAFNGYYRRRVKPQKDIDSLEEQPVDVPDQRTPFGGGEHGLRFLWALLCSSAAGLSDRQRQVVWLVAVERLEHSEAAVIVGITEGYCRQEYSRARAKLRNAFPEAARISYWRGEDLLPSGAVCGTPTSRAPYDVEFAPYQARPCP
ncbi:MAG: sigma-70 family RNA polymerase sigma factor [Armatimonadetes bacterium]|nr:sigma-70 family RNA polymerase sigma factor [Armatimonadota bacterium]